MQLKSAMMMNLESRFILCEDMGRFVIHTLSFTSINVSFFFKQTSIRAECKAQCRRTDR